MSTTEPPDSLTITPDPATVTDDDSLQFTVIGHWVALGIDSDLTRGVIWSSSDTAVATIQSGASRGGLCIGVSPGTATITALWYGGSIAGPTIDEPVTATVTLTVTAAPPLVDPAGRVNIAFGWTTLDPNPEWTQLDAYPNLITSYTIQRGRTHELDHTDTGRATIEIIDPDGVLDTTNPDGPGADAIRPLVQAAIGRRNPVTGEWSLRFRGFVEDFDYDVDPSRRFNRLTITLVDLFELLNVAEMRPGVYGNEGTPPDSAEGQVWLREDNVGARINYLLDSYGLPRRYQAILPGNVLLASVTYSPGESLMTALSEAADGEGPPSLSNLYCDRHGRIAFQGRYGRLAPAELAAATSPGTWDYHDWKVGDGPAIAASPSDTVQVRELKFNRGLSSIINSAVATPQDASDAAIEAALVVDNDSIDFYGPRSWSANGLLTHRDNVDGTLRLDQTHRYSTFIVLNYRDIRDRPSAGFRALAPDDPRAPALWAFLNTVEIGDRILITATAGGSGGPVIPGGSSWFFVEGIQEEVRPLVPDYDDVTLRLTLTAQDYYMHNPFPEMP